MSDTISDKTPEKEQSERRIIVTGTDGIPGIVGIIDGVAASHVPSIDGRPAFKLVRSTPRAVYYVVDTDPVEGTS